MQRTYTAFRPSSARTCGCENGKNTSTHRTADRTSSSATRLGHIYQSGTSPLLSATPTSILSHTTANKPSIFFPKSYDQTSPATLPTLFTIHGGGFCIGHSRDDDEWNRRFANIHRTLVISLNYSKSPWHPFPTALHDVEALLLACLADVSLPIERAKRPNTTLSRTAILGFSAGGNLALAVSQLPSIRCHAQTPPAAALSVYGCLDLSVPPAEKLSNRPTKPSLPSPRGGKDAGSDHLAGLAPAFDWSYVPYGHDLRDPLLSPAFADKARLPPFVGVVAAELDMLAHESWRLACRLSRRRSGGLVPDRLSGDERERVCGRREVGRRRGALEDINNERFGFEESWDDDAGRGGVKWLLVPDVLHGFDNPHIRGLMGGEATIKDAEMKTRAYVEELGNWLRERVWGL